MRDYDSDKKPEFMLEKAIHGKRKRKVKNFRSDAGEYELEGKQYRQFSEVIIASHAEMYQIRGRLENGMTLEEAVKIPCRGRAVKDHTGQSFPTIQAMCDAWGVNYNTFLHRRWANKTLKQALTGE